ncbi:MAG: hypothetical protein WBP10_15245 [Thermoanaerobaculia bacterium]
MQLTTSWILAMLGSLGLGTATAECPSPGAILTKLHELDLTAAARTRDFQLEPPRSLYEKAAAKPGKVALQKDGKLGHAVLVTDLPIEALWMAANDEDHYAEDGYIPVLHSEVIGGTPRGQDRILFQYFKRAGIGRWWIDQVVMSDELFAESDGMLWELRWWDLMETRTEQSLPEELSQSLDELGLSPIRASRGTWLMIPIEADCTLIEYVTVSDPGGFLSLAQSLGAGRVIRDTLQGVEKLAREHIPTPHEHSRFVRPDGTSLKAPND